MKKTETDVLLEWLEARRTSAEARVADKARDGDFGGAQLSLGHAEAYSFTIQHLEGLVRRAKAGRKP